MMSKTVDQHLPGQVILGRFQLDRLLGSGGMGTVWEARHLSLDTQIAIKFVNAELSRRRDVAARFALEATSAAKIRSPHVVSILDSGFTEDGHGFYAMELLRGEDLGRRLARFGRLGVSETALLVTHVCRGLTKAHSIGLIHRDLKPENIFLVEEDETLLVKILDFGIAKWTGAEVATHKTDTGQLLGTPHYMSPEQVRGRPIDARSDLYSLAVVAYRCLTGRLPFSDPAVGEVIVAISTEPAPPASQFNPSLPPTIDAWFAGTLAKEAGQRLAQNAVDFTESFNRACGTSRDSPLPPSNDPHAPTRLEPGRVPPSDTEDSSAFSAEAIATTIAVAQLPAPRVSKWKGGRSFGKWLAGLAIVAALGVSAMALRPRPIPVAHSTQMSGRVAPPSKPVSHEASSPVALLGSTRPAFDEPKDAPPAEHRSTPHRNDTKMPAAGGKRVVAPAVQSGPVSDAPPAPAPNADGGTAAAASANAATSVRPSNGAKALPIDREPPW